MKVTLLPLLLIGSLLMLSAALALIVRDPSDATEQWAAAMLLGAGLVCLGAWLAVEIRELRRKDDG